MLIFRIRDYLSVLFYRFFTCYLFARFGKSVRIVFPLRIIGAKYISLHSRVTLQYGGFFIAVKSSNSVPNLEIKSGTMIGNFAHIVCTGQVLINENVLIADRVFITDNTHGFKNLNIPILAQHLIQIGDVVIGENSFIGENVCIIGSKIGKHCVVGSNSVVTRDVPDYTVVVGSPAIPIRKYCHVTREWIKWDE